MRYDVLKSSAYFRENNSVKIFKFMKNVKINEKCFVNFAQVFMNFHKLVKIEKIHEKLSNA